MLSTIWEEILQEISADINPADINPADINPADINPADINPADINPADINPADINPADNYQSLVDKLKEKLSTRDQKIYKDWEKSGFSVYHQFPFQNQDIKNEGTLLHIAAYCGQKTILNIVLEEIQSNASVSVENNNTTPEEALLLQQKASINSPDKDGATALHWAAWGGSDIMVNFLLTKEGINANITDNKDGATALHWAARSCTVNAVESLLSQKDMVNLEDKNGKTPLHWAVKGNNISVVNRLLQYNNIHINAKDKDNKSTPLHLAAQENYVGILESLLKHSASVHSSDGKQNTPLHLAAQRGHLDAVNILLQEGADPLLKNEDNQTPKDVAYNEKIKNLLGKKEIIQTAKSLVFCTTLIVVLAATNSIIQGNTKPLAFSILAVGVLAMIVIGSLSCTGAKQNISDISTKIRDTQATVVASSMGKSGD